MRRKHVPQRTCVTCRQVRSKREMVRLVRTPEGEVAVDETGKRKGRGAYLCRRKACWKAALDGSQLEQALQVHVDPQVKEILRDFSATLTD